MNKYAKRIVWVGMAAISGLASQSAFAELTANAAVTSNYMWRGETQTDDGPAVQGGIDYAHESGAYVGAWASNVDGPLPSGDEGIEYDLYAGFSKEVSGVTYDIGYLTYNYTEKNYADNASEIKLGIGYGPATLNYYLGDDSTNTYNQTELLLDFELPHEIELALDFGALSGDAAKALGDDQITDYGVSVSKNFGGFDVKLGYADSEHDDGKAYVTVSKEFEL